MNVAIIGMGGFAGAHHDAVRRLEAEGRLRLLATCDPAWPAFAQRRAELDLEGRGVRCYDDYRQLLDDCAGELDFVTLPTPILLHAPMHAACVAHDVPVYLEKPPTLSVAELEAMIALDAGARRATQVGFNFIVDPLRQATKQRLLDGEFGRLRRVTVFGAWPRPASYYTRNDWAGRLHLDGRLVLDSPLGNAMAHLVHNALWWCGTSELWEWGTPRRVYAELYRAHAIQGADTVFLDAAMDSGVSLALGLTHACAGESRQLETLECERATLHYYTNERTPDGQVQRLAVDADGRREVRDEATLDRAGGLLRANLLAYADYVRGDTARPLTRLSDCRPFVQLNNLAYVSSGGVHQVPEQQVRRAADGSVEAGLREALERFLLSGQPPRQTSESVGPEALGRVEQVVGLASTTPPHLGSSG